MPVNRPTHGHGQGYSDLNFLIPELMSYVVARKGPYFADEGDFSSAGAVHIYYKDEVPNGLFTATMGSFDYGRLLVDRQHQALRRHPALGDRARHLQWPLDGSRRRRTRSTASCAGRTGTPENGLAIDAMAYANRWHAQQSDSPSAR